MSVSVVAVVTNSTGGRAFSSDCWVTMAVQSPAVTSTVLVKVRAIAGSVPRLSKSATEKSCNNKERKHCKVYQVVRQVDEIEKDSLMNSKR